MFIKFSSSINRFFFNKEERLKSRKLIELLFKEGASFSVNPIKVIYVFSDDENVYGIKAGFTASKRNFKKAVDRNRIKRLLREAYRVKKNDIIKKESKQLSVFFIYIGKDLPDFLLIKEKMQAAIIKLNTILNEAP